MKKAIALMLCLAMASTFVACGTTAPEEDLYQTEPSAPSENTQTPGDEDIVVIPGGDNEGEGEGESSVGEGNSAEQQAFLDSVPEDLAGSKVEILVWYKALDSQVAKMQRFEDATGIDVEFVYADETNYLNKLASMKAAGNAPEIACIRAGDYPLSILQDYFHALTEDDMAVDVKGAEPEESECTQVLYGWNWQQRCYLKYYQLEQDRCAGMRIHLLLFGFLADMHYLCHQE